MVRSVYICLPDVLTTAAPSDISQPSNVSGGMEGGREGENYVGETAGGGEEQVVM